jgi:pyruvate/2-oxoglutarate dehydrogenase complex dihydrolipoamide dehydrogenase (E3) component
MPGDEFDVIVIGAGPAGEVVASRLAGRGYAPALIERELVGGECAYWACMPSKTLLRAPEVASEARRTAGTSGPEQRFDEIAAYRDFMVRNLDDSEEIETYEKSGTRVFKGTGTITGPGEVEVGGRTVRSGRIVIATGSAPVIPPIEGLAQAGHWTSREVTSLKRVPASALVLGGGPVGIELSQLLHGFGTQVTLVEAADRLLEREDPRVGELILEALREEGIEVVLGAELRSVSKADGLKHASLADGRELAVEEIVIASGRAPRTEGLGLANVGIEVDERGAIGIDERCRAADGVWAIGDVTGTMPFSHVAMYQGRIVVADISGQDVRADYSAVPRVVFSDPEIAAVGLTPEQARTASIDAVSQTIALKDSIARPWTYETEPRGELSILVDRDRRVLAGAWAVGPLASEWIHYAALAIKTQIPLSVLSDTVAQFPTYTEAYLKAIEKLEL